jgi:hypothetical protein
MLTNADFHMSKREDLNDPLDMTYSTTLENFLNLYTEKYQILELKKEHLDNASSLFKDALERGSSDWVNIFDKSHSLMRISCFTEDGDNPLMWSHYSDNHKGVCLKFKPSIDKKFEDNIHEVKYKNELLEIKELKDIKESILTKLKVWEIEKEWRLLSEKERFPFNQDALVEIVLGLKVPFTTMSWFKLFRESVYYMHAPIYQLQIRHNKLIKVNIEDLNEY